MTTSINVFHNAFQRILLIFIISMQWVLPQCVLSQDKKPKVALVLSGGGAKGLAHIPTLQVLDSLGIVPDLVVGNSMGSVVGGLYAMGYSGDSIASIVKHVKWDKLIGGRISLRDVSVEEKSEFNQYMVSVDWSEGKLELGTFFLNDQNLRGFISSMTYPIYKVNNFDNLSIPFRAIATDIVNGKELILDKGSLSYAMRASMSIPGVFSPVPYKETLLIDGGVLNNFPVDVAENLGADIIIGSDVGSGMVTKEKLKKITDLLFQAGMLSSYLKYPANRRLCDILIDHHPNLSYSTEDFNKSNEIYEEGKIAVSKNLNALVALSKRLKKFKQRKHELPYVKDEFVLDTVVYTNISKTNLALVKARTNILPNKKYSRLDLIDGINRGMGTTIFSEITYKPLINGDKLGMQFNGVEKSRHQIKGSLHYDSDHGVGLIVNYTGRNIIGEASRSLITIDIAEQPKFRVQHQKNFGPSRNWWWRSEVFGQQVKQKIFINGDYVDNFRSQYLDFDNQVNRNLSPLRSFLGIGLKFQYVKLKPTINPEINNNIFNLSKYNFQDFELYTHYQYNSMNEVFFATRGTTLQSFLGRSFQNNVKVAYSDETIATVKGSINDFTKFGLDYERRFLLTDRTTAIIGGGAHFIVEDDLRGDDLSFSEYGLGSKYFLGGNILNPRKDSHVFPGLNETELNVNQFIKLNLGLQMRIMNNFYLTPHVDVASVGFEGFNEYIKEAFTANGKWEDAIETSLVMSSGATFSYNSKLGPINFDASWVNGTDKVRFFIGIGFQFN